MVTLHFTNKHHNPVDVLWNQDGNEQRTAILRPGQSYRQSSNPGDRWHIRDRSNNRLITTHVTLNDEKIFIREEIRRIDPDQPESRYLNTTGSLVGARAPQFALQFDGEGDIVIIPHDKGLDLVKSWTLEAWIFRTSKNGEQTIIEKSGNSQMGGYCLKVAENNRLQGGFFNSGDFIYVQSETVLEAMRWYHVAVSFNDQADELRCYLDGRLNGSTTRISRGMAVNRAVLQFDGQNDYLSVQTTVSKSTYSAGFWFKTAQTGVGLFCVDSGIRGADGSDRNIFLDQNGNLCVCLLSEERLTSTDINFADDRWHHVVHTLDSNTGEQRLYTDGALVASGKYTPSNFSQQDGINFGFSPVAPNPYFAGQLAEVNVWNICLTEEYIKAVWRMQLRGTEAGLQGLWHLNQGYGVYYPDVTTNGHDACLEGTRQILPMTTVRLDGGYIDADILDLNSKSFTLSLWAKRDTSVDRQCLMAQGADSVSGFFFGFINNRLAFAFADYFVSTSVDETELQWHHYGCQLDTVNQTVALFRDGAVVATGSNTPVYSGRGALLIGKSPWDTDCFYGQVAEIAIWQQVRDIAGINQDWESCPLGTEEGMLAMWSRALTPDQTADQRAGLWNFARSRQHATFQGTVTTEIQDRPYSLPESAPRWNRYSELRLVPLDLCGEPSTAPLCLGGRSRDDQNTFRGIIDSVRIWATTRDPSEILAQWNQELLGNERGLRAYFPFDEGNGLIVKDLSSEGNNGTLGRGDTETRPAWTESTLLLMDGLRFDGVDDWVSLPPIEVDFSEGFTIEAWVYLEHFNFWSRIIDLSNGLCVDNIFFSTRDTQPDLALCVYQNGAELSLIAPGVLQIGEWMHLAGTIDPTGAAKLYVNGKMVATGTLAVPVQALRRKNYIGRCNSPNDGYFKGCLDEIRLWRVARSEEQIQGYLRRRLPAGDQRLLGLFPCDEGSGAVLFDNTENGLHGLLGGGEAKQQPTWQRQGGRDDIGLYFDGIDDYVSIPAALLNNLSIGTIELWLSWNGKIAGTLLGQYYGEEQLRLSITTDGRLEFRSTAAGSVGQSLTSLWPRRWYHLAVVFNSNQLMIYIDGNLDRTITGNFSIPASPSDAKASLGSSGSGQTAFFAGILDEVRIWSAPRLALQIQANMSRRVAPDSSGLVAYYPIEDGAGINLYDRSIYRYHGTLGGGDEARCPHWLEGSPVQFDGMKFNGSGDYLEIANTETINVCSNFSLSTWIRPGMLQGMQTIAAKIFDAQDCQYALSLDGEMLRFDYERGGNNYSLVGGQLQNGWNHIAVTVLRQLIDTPVVQMDESGQPKQQTVITASGEEIQCPVVEIQKLDMPDIRLYVNGLLATTGTAPAATLPSNAPLIIGGLCTEQRKENFFYGVIDSVLLHDAALSQDELQWVMNHRLPDYAPHLLCYFRLPVDLELGAGVPDRTGRNQQAIRHHFERFASDADAAVPQGTIDLCSADSIMVLTDPPVLSSFTVEMWVNTLSFRNNESSQQQVLVEGRGIGDFGTDHGEVRFAIIGGQLLLCSFYFDMDSRFNDYLTQKSQQALSYSDWEEPWNFDCLVPGWHHLALTFDCTADMNSVIRVVVDGQYVLQATRDSLSRHPFKIKPNQKVRILHIGNSESGERQIGLLDEVRIWDHVRHDTQIRQFMRQRLLGTESGLYGYWRFEEGTGAITRDYTPRGKAAELHGEHRWIPQSDLHLPLAVFKPRNEMTALELRSTSLSPINFPPPSWGKKVFESDETCIDFSLTFFISSGDLSGAISIWHDYVKGILLLTWPRQMALWLRNDGRVVIGVMDADQQRILTSNTALYPDRFSHITVVWNDSEERYGLYFNGVLDNDQINTVDYSHSDTFLNTWNAHCEATNSYPPLSFDEMQNFDEEAYLKTVRGFFFAPVLSGWYGCENQYSDYSQPTQVGQIAIFNRALTAEEVAQRAKESVFHEKSEPTVAWLFELAPIDLSRNTQADTEDNGQQGCWCSWTDHSGLSLPQPETCLSLQNQRNEDIVWQLKQQENAYRYQYSDREKNWKEMTALRTEWRRLERDQDGVDLGSIERLHMQGDEFSFESWLYNARNREDKVTPILHFSGNQNGETFCFGLSEGCLAVVVADQELRSNFELNLETWYHVAFSVREQGNEILFYVNGRLVHHITGLGKRNYGGDIRLGYMPFRDPDVPRETPYGFSGNICDVALWDRERTGEEIARDYRERLSPTERGLIGYWRLDEVSGRYALDSSVGRHHGVLVGDQAAWTRRIGLVVVEGGTPQEPTAQDVAALEYFQKLPTPVLPETVADTGVLAPIPSAIEPGAVFTFSSMPEDSSLTQVNVAPDVVVTVSDLPRTQEHLDGLPGSLQPLADTLFGAMDKAEGNTLNLSTDLLGDFDPLTLLAKLSPEFLKIREPKLKTIGSADGGDGMIFKTVGLRLSGKVELFGMAPIAVEADFYTQEQDVEDSKGNSSKQKKSGYMLKFYLPEPFSLKGLIGDIPVLGGIQFYKASEKHQSVESRRLLGIIVTNDSVASIRLIPGVNFYGTIRIATSDDPVFQFIGKLFHVDELQLHVAMTPTMFAMETVLGIDLEIIPGKLWFREMGVGMKVVTAPPQSEISMFSTLEAKIGDDRLRFTGQLAVQQTKGVSVTGSLSMEGMWCDPFGIQGVAIGDLAAQVAVKPEFPWLDQLGVTGKLRIGRASALMAVLIDSNDPDKCIFVGDANDVKIPDIINTLCGPGIMPHELRDVLDQFELRSLKISVVPSAVYIGTFYFDEKGITIKVGITIMGWSGDLYLRVDYNDGINGYATIDPINIAGILEVRESRDEQGLARTRLFCCAKNCFPRKPSNLQVKAGTCTEEINGVICGRQLVPKVGPQIYLNISAYRTPELYLSGYASLLGISVEAFIHLQRNGLITDVRGAIWGLFQAQLKLRIASDLSYVYIRAEMRNDLFVRLRMEAVKAIHDFVHTSERALDEAMASVRAAQHEVDKLLDEVNRMRFVVRQEREAISRRLREAQDTLDGAQRNVNSLLNEIESTKRWYGSLPAFSWPWNPSKARDWIWVGPKLAGLYIAYGVATAALTVARWALQAADFLVLNIPIDMDPRIIALLAAHGIATLALTVAENGLAGTKAMVQGFAWVSEQVVRLALGELFDIRYALFEGEFSSAQSLMKVDMAAEIVFLRMNLSVQFTMDFGDIAGTASSLVRRLIAAHAV